MRRNRRKLAAQLLDQQLSQVVDETLTKANYPPRSRPCLLPARQNSTDTLPQPGYIHSTQPELPLPKFSKFDLVDFPHFTFSSNTPPLVRTPTPFRTLPKWCPKIPSLTLGDVWRDFLPTFHDLSSLPEPAEIPSASPQAVREQCKDLQVWRPIGKGYGRDQSRFFPPRSLLTSEELGNERTSGVTVKLPPPVACRLHHSDTSVDSSPTVPMSYPNVRRLITVPKANSTTSLPSLRSEQSQDSPFIPTHYGEGKPQPTVIMVPDPADDPAVDFLSETTAITPEGNLKTNTTSVEASDDPSSCTSVTAQSCQTLGKAQQRTDASGCHPSHYIAEQPPCELDARETEIPYVHANSLTGHSNDRDVLDVSPAYEQRRALADSGVGLPIIFADEPHHLVGLNELVVDHDIVASTNDTTAAGVALPVSLPATPPATPPLRRFIDMANILPVACIVEAEHNLSDAHYHSEQALFCQSPLSLAQSAQTLHESTTSSSINIAEFLNLGHAKQCWCGHCTEGSYDASRNGANAFSSSTTLADHNRAKYGDNDLTLSLLLHPSDSEPDTESDDPELLDSSEAKADHTKYVPANVGAIEDDDWLLFLPSVIQPVEEPSLSAPAMYVPSSPILHRQMQQELATPAVITGSSSASANEASDDYIAVAAPAAAATGAVATNLGWHDMFPRTSSAMWKAELATCDDESFGCGFAGSNRGNWKWGRESEEEWWDWAVEEEC